MNYAWDIPEILFNPKFRTSVFTNKSKSYVNVPTNKSGNQTFIHFCFFFLDLYRSGSLAVDIFIRS